MDVQGNWDNDNAMDKDKNADNVTFRNEGELFVET